MLDYVLSSCDNQLAKCCMISVMDDSLAVGVCFEIELSGARLSNFRFELWTSQLYKKRLIRPQLVPLKAFQVYHLQSASNVKFFTLLCTTKQSKNYSCLMSSLC